MTFLRRVWNPDVKSKTVLIDWAFRLQPRGVISIHGRRIVFRQQVLRTQWTLPGCINSSTTLVSRRRCEP